MNDRGPENAIPIVLAAVALAPATWTAQGVVWLAPWIVTFALYFLSAFSAVFGAWLMVGWSTWHPSRLEILRLAGAALVFFGIAELLAGLSPAPRSRPAVTGPAARQHFVADPSLGWRLRPRHSAGWPAVNPHPYASGPGGFRVETSTPATSEPRPARRRPIAFVGGSSTFGVGVRFAETFAARVAAEIGRPVDNFAQPGFRIDQTALAAQHLALTSTPAAAVFAFVDPDRPLEVGVEGFTAPRFVVDGGALRLRTPDDRPSPAFRWLRQHSQLWALAFEVDHRLGRSIEWGDGSAVLKRVLVEQYRRSQAADVPMLFVRLPVRRPPLNTDAPAAYPLVQDTLHQVGAPYLDLGGSGPVRARLEHFRADGHLNAAGHRWVAQQIGPALARLLDPLAPNRPSTRSAETDDQN